MNQIIQMCFYYLSEDNNGSQSYLQVVQIMPEYFGIQVTPYCTADNITLTKEGNLHPSVVSCGLDASDIEGYYSGDIQLRFRSNGEIGDIGFQLRILFKCECLIIHHQLFLFIIIRCPCVTCVFITFV